MTAKPRTGAQTKAPRKVPAKSAGHALPTTLSLDDVCAAIPEETAALLRRVCDCAAGSQEVHLVGGPVRDLLLKRPLSDVDLRVESGALDLAKALCESKSGADLRYEAHDRFGTVRIESAAAAIDVATLRHETYATPGALPDVVTGTLEQDARRRDFSVNALHVPLDGRAPSTGLPIVDLEGGLADLERRSLRILHPQSFHDDPTRAFRAARFAARLSFRLERGSRAALRDALRDGAFGGVSGERFRRELQLVFAEASQGVPSGKVLRSLSDWHVLGALEPGLALPPDRALPLRRLSKSIAEPDWSAPRWKGWIAGLSIWLAPLPAAQRRRVLERFSIRGEQAKRIVAFGRNAERTLKALARARGRGAVDALLAPLPEENVQALYSLADVAVRRRILRWGAEDRRRRAPVSGGDLVEVGLQGEDIGLALARIRTAFLDGELLNREEALALAGEIARRSGQSRSRAKPRKSPRKVAPTEPIADTSEDVDGGSTRASE